MSFLSSGWRRPEEIVATAKHEEHLADLRERYGIETTLSNADAAKAAEVIVIAVKPQDIEALLADGPVVEPGQTVLLDRRGDSVRLHRGPPGRRRPRRSRHAEHARDRARGMANRTGRESGGEEHLARAEEVLGSVGRSVRVDEDYMDAITAVSGSGPAYFALLAESMIEAGILLGLSREIATDLVVQTMLGTAKLLRDEKMHPVELREMVTSPAGQR